MDRREVLERLDADRRRLARHGEVVDVLPSVTRLRAADGSHHCVIYSSLTAETADGVIAAEVEHHRRLGVGFEWKLYAHDGPPDLLDRLRRHGFEVGPLEVVLACDLADLPAWMNDMTEARPDDVRVERVEHPEQVDAFRRVAEAVFGKDYGFTAGQLAEAIRIGSTQHRGYVAYAGDEPVSVGRLYTHPHSAFGGLYGGGTLAAYRGRGFYRATVAARARDAAALGARYLVVDALPTSRPVLERMGFRRLTDTWPCEWRNE
jgi:hypothetical protein